MLFLPRKPFSLPSIQTMNPPCPPYACPKAFKKNPTSGRDSFSFSPAPQTNKGAFPASKSTRLPSSVLYTTKNAPPPSFSCSCMLCVRVYVWCARAQGCKSTSLSLSFLNGKIREAYTRVDYQSSSSSFSRCMAFLRARRASARLPPRLGVGVLLRLPVLPFSVLRLMPESRCCSSAGLRLAAGRLAGGCGGVGLARGGAGGARGAGGACS